MYIFIFTLITLIFILIYEQNKRLNTEIRKKRISDSLLIGINKANQHFMSQLNYVVNKRTDYEKVEKDLNDLILKEVEFYSILIYSFENNIPEDEWNMIFNNPKFNYDVFCSRFEPLREIWLTVAILILYKNNKTKDKALKQLDSVPLEVKSKILRITNHQKHSDSLNWCWDKDVY